MRHSMLLGLALLAFASGAQAKPAIVYSSDPEIDKTAQYFWKMARNDVDGRPIPRRTLIGDDWYRTPFGMQVDSHCFELLKPRSRDEIARALDEKLNKAVDRVLNGCGSAYPEIGAYILQWAQKLARTALSCTSLTQTQIQAGAYNAPNIDGIMTGDKPGMTRAEFERLKKLPTMETAPEKSGQPLIVFPKENLWELLFGFDIEDQGLDALIHEAFHSTSANNRLDHNDVERVNPNNICDDSAAVDRVCMFASLCSGAELHRIHRPAQDVLFQRMLQCGDRKKACEQLFTSDFLSSDGHGKDAGPRSRGIYFDAPKLCDRIFNEGCCREYTGTTKGKKHVMARPEVRKLAEKVQDRMNELLPRKLNEIPAATVKAFPELYDSLKSMQELPCFKKVFSGDVDSGLTVNGVAATALTDKERFTSADYSPWMKTLESAVKSAGDSDDCPASKAIPFRSRVEELSDTLHKAMGSPVLTGQIMTRRYDGYEHAATDLSGAGIKEISVADAALARWIDGRRIGDVFGPSLYHDYQSALGQYHPNGKFFSCASLSIEEYGMLGCYSKIVRDPAPFCANLGY